MALITKRNKPNVTIVAGKVKNTNNGLTIIFNKEIAIETQTAVPKLATAIPGKILDNNSTTNDVSTIFKSIFIYNL